MDKYEHAREQAQAKYESIKEMVEALQAANEWHEKLSDAAAQHDGGREDAERAIYEDALSVEVRSGWRVIGTDDDDPVEYRILLCTGGPAVRIVGDLNEHCEPETARLEMQDWFVLWQEYQPHGGPGEAVAPDYEQTLLAYARCFYFGD